MATTPMIDTTHDLSLAIEALDGGLSHLRGREIVSTNEVADLLLDVRGILSGIQKFE